MEIKLKAYIKTIPTKGNLVYEYNPLHNYRLQEDKFLYKDDYYTEKELNSQFGISYDTTNKVWNNVPINETAPVLYQKGTLVDFITDELTFDLKHPVNILPQYSYDGSVNLILNDGVNIPRLINTRFSATGSNTYEIVDRKGNNDTNIYDAGQQFDIDTSLYKRVISIPKINYNGVSAGGNLKVGNYHFYFKLADEDGNETDFIGESGLVSIFIGFGGSNSQHTGTKNENSFKSVNFQITNIDTAYNYLYVYYTRSTAELNENYITEYIKIDKKFIVNNLGICNLHITGNENTAVVSNYEINLNYETVDAAKAQVTCQNMLFLGNVHKPTIPYNELQDLSLRFLPSIDDMEYPLDQTYEYHIQSVSKGYLDDKFIYNYVGYWNNELYRLGVVYILKNGELSPVFNIRGAVIEKGIDYTKTPIYIDDQRNYIKYNNSNLLTDSKVTLENVKGVIKISDNVDTNVVHGIKITGEHELLEELSKYVKGFFFVRQPRIPTILAQGLSLGIDKVSRTPCIPTKGGFMDSLAQLRNTYIETTNINDVNYISEGFLTRYSFKASSVLSNIASKTYQLGISNGKVNSSFIESNSEHDNTYSLKDLINTSVSETSKSEETTIDTFEFKGRNNPIYRNVSKKEQSSSRLLGKDFIDRVIIKDDSKVNNQCIICPDYEVNQGYYNQIFTGNTHMIRYSNCQGLEGNYLSNDSRHFYFKGYEDVTNQENTTIDIIAVPDDTKVVGLNNVKFRSRAGEAEEAWRYEQVGTEYVSDTEKQENTDIIRGSFGAYLATDSTNLGSAKIFDILIPNYQEGSMQEYFSIRMDDNTSYQAISERLDIKECLKTTVSSLENNSKDFELTVYRGDCYLCQFTHRLNRNFNSPSAPYNNEIVDENSWRDNYKVNKQEDLENINLGDVNAVELGMWVTFRLRSSYNLNIRTLDGSNVDETQMTGHPRGYFPYYPISTDGTYKTPESQLYNKGFSKSLSERFNFELPDVPYIKNWFGTRIMYSDIHINDAYKNGYRVFRKTRAVDYTREYGEIVKLISLNSNLLIVFEHGIAIAPVNSQLLAQQAGQVIATQQVLPEAPNILSDKFGSQWADSIIKTDFAVYGIDTIAKKIWRTDGTQVECISDFKVQEFLNNNITLSERENTPVLGICNVKSFYNAYKHDVMFTFYDNTYGYQEKVWNLCYNEILGKFITFYSWIPSYMENINNISFSFNRDTSKWIAKLGQSHSSNSFADGITLTNTVFDTTKDIMVDDLVVPIQYVDKYGNLVSDTIKPNVNNYYIGTLALTNRIIPDSNVFYNIEYKLQPDIYGNYEKFEILPLVTYQLPDNAKYYGKSIQLYALYLKSEYKDSSILSELYYRNKLGNCYSDDETNKTVSSIDNTITNNLPIFKNKEGKRLMLPKDQKINEDTIVKLLNIKAIIKVSDSQYNFGTYQSVVCVMPKWNMQFLTTDFWKHGQAGIFDIADDIYPCYWYGKQHPFEFECVVVNDPSTHKIFTNLEIVANKAKPESFHYEIIGEAYDFAKDKPNMYFRQEAMKALWQYNGCDIEYNSNFTKVQTRQQPKSADLPHTYYARQKGLNEVEDYYINAAGINSDYRHLSGGEIVYYPNRQEFRVWQHALAVDVDDQKDTSATSFGGRGLIASNMRYLEDRWKVQINPLLIVYKNEYTRKNIDQTLCTPENSTWALAKDGVTKLPLLPLYNSPIPDKVLQQGEIKIPGLTSTQTDNAFEDLYQIIDGSEPFDTTNWLNDVNIYKHNFGNAQNRKEVDLRDKFIKIRIRYTGDELVVIDFLNTLYQISYA